MNITTFEEKDFVKQRITRPFIHVTYGRLILSAKLVKTIGIKMADRVLLHQDNYQPHVWYLSIEEKGFIVSGTPKSSALNINSTSLSFMILKAFGFDKTDIFNFIMDETPVEDSGVKYWKLVPQG